MPIPWKTGPISPQPTPTPTVTYTPQQFEATFGVKPDIPSDAVIMGVTETDEGYQLTYYVRGEPTRRRRFVGEPPPSAVARKLGFLEGSLLIGRGYAFEPRRGVYAKYETVFPELQRQPTEREQYREWERWLARQPSEVRYQYEKQLWRRARKAAPKGAEVISVRTTPEGTIAKYIITEPIPSWKETTAAGKIYRGERVWKGPKLHLYEFEELPKEAQQRVLTFTAPLRETVAGFVGIGETWLRPEVPTPVGAVVGVPLGRPEQFEAYRSGEVSLFYLAGGLVGTYFEAKAMGFAFQKAWVGVKKVAPHVIKEPIARAVKFGRLPKAIYRAKLAMKYREPIYTLTHIPTKIKTYVAMRFPSAKVAIERSLAWGGEKWLVPSGFETWATTVEAHKFVGYPIIYGKLAGYGIIQVVKPTAFQQIMFQIEKGMFPAMGGMAGRMYPVFAKTGEVTWTTRALAFPTVAETVRRAAMPSAIGLGVSPFAKLVRRPRRKRREVTRALLVPKLERFQFEREKERFRELELLVPKIEQKERLALVQPQLLKEKTVLKAVQTQQALLKTVPKIPTPTKLTLPYPYRPRFRRRETEADRFERLFGKWFFRRHPIPTATEQFAMQMMGVKPRRKAKKKKGGR